MGDKVVLDDCNCDLNFVVEDYGYGASTVNYPLGFRLTWAGGRATHGVCKGRVFFEVRIASYLDGVCDGGEFEPHPNVVRIGWSTSRSSYSLGEDSWSFGFGGTGKFSNRKRFTEYGEPFRNGDVIGAMLDLNSKPATMSFMKNGRDLGVAHTFRDFPVGNTAHALFPHIFNKNCKIKVNFGQSGAWYPPPQGFTYIQKAPVANRVRGLGPPREKSQCEVIMLIGLPGCGKTTLATELQKTKPDKSYYILGTDNILQQMRVMGLSRAFNARWQLLIELATECLNTLFGIAGSKARNYIIDQTNVFDRARRKKMLYFQGFRKVAIVVQPEDAELVRRAKKRTAETKKDVPHKEVRRMKANFTLPEPGGVFHVIQYPELPHDAAERLVDRYNLQNAQYKN